MSGSAGYAWGPERPVSLAAAVACVVLVVALARLYWLARFGVSMPFWDQWDAEGATLLKPWLEGSLRPADLVALHNEHRILPTRLATLVVFSLTGEWNNLYEARANVALYALVCASLALLALPNTPLRRGGWCVAAAIMLLGALPFAWENLLVGFQSQFYFLMLFGTWAVALAAARPNRPLALAAVVLLSAVSSLTMASGLLTPVVCAALCVASAFNCRVPPWPALATAVLLLAIAGFSYMHVPAIPDHQVLRAHGAGDFLHALSHVLGWPGDSFHWTGLWLWAPAAVYGCVRLRLRSLDGQDLVFLGLVAWSVAQSAAIAYGRGHDLLELAPRYRDLMVPGLVASAWCCTRLWWLFPSANGPRLASRLLVAGFAVVLAGTLVDRSGKDWAAAAERGRITRVQAGNVASYLRSGDPRDLDRPFFEIPYPSAERLRTWLDDPVIAGTLPASATRPPASTPPR